MSLGGLFPKKDGLPPLVCPTKSPAKGASGHIRRELRVSSDHHQWEDIIPPAPPARDV
jgi:hypothetical protein